MAVEGPLSQPRAAYNIAAFVVLLACYVTRLARPAQAAPEGCTCQSLERDVGKPPVYNWDEADAWANDPHMTPIFEAFKSYGIPAASLGIQLNPAPWRVDYDAPKKWRNPQYWWMAGFGLSYKTPMRVASISKPLIAAGWQRHSLLRRHIGKSFYQVWKQFCGPLPTPKDYRVLSITVRHLLDHKSGFSNAGIGFDPGFRGKFIDDLVAEILTTKTLSSAPGTSFSYLNFGYDILARLGTCITGDDEFVRDVFPIKTQKAPVFAARDTVSQRHRGCEKCAATDETSLYWVQQPDGEFDISPGGRSANFVTNVAALTWFATQYWIGGPQFGKRFTRPVPPGYTWVFNGAFPGTSAVLAQFTTPGGYVSSICIIVPTRPPDNGPFFDALTKAGIDLLQKKFG